MPATITLAYRLSEDFADSGVDVAVADELTLRYECFLGDITFVAAGVDLSARWGWVPVLDFALSLRDVCVALPAACDQAFEFTESDAEIYFHRRGESVDISASYAPGRATVSMQDLNAASSAFLHDTVLGLTVKEPAARQNPFIRELARQVVMRG